MIKFTKLFSIICLAALAQNTITVEGILSGVDTALDEFKWTALLEYRKVGQGKTTFPCLGSLINERYVLTAAHCVTGEILKIHGRLVNVRLGEYNTATIIDCDESNDCATNQFKEISVEEIISHPNFEKKYVHNDIALVRLSSNVEYGRFIGPISMPWFSKAGVTRTFTYPSGTNMTIAGWGRTSTASNSDRKQKLELQVYDQQQCKRRLSNVTTIISSQICAGGEYRKDSCSGDAGGPLMHRVDGIWELAGIISSGVACGLEDLPGIYTRVNEYKDWIENNLKA